MVSRTPRSTQKDSAPKAERAPCCCTVNTSALICSMRARGCAAQLGQHVSLLSVGRSPLCNGMCASALWGIGDIQTPTLCTLSLKLLLN